jgi:hypothetical protein
MYTVTFPTPARHRSTSNDTFTFQGYAKVTTPAGTFDTCKVRFDYQSGLVETYYHAPGLHWVRLDSTLQGVRTTRELIAAHALSQGCIAVAQQVQRVQRRVAAHGGAVAGEEKVRGGRRRVRGSPPRSTPCPPACRRSPRPVRRFPSPPQRRGPAVRQRTTAMRRPPRR